MSCEVAFLSNPGITHNLPSTHRPHTLKTSGVGSCHSSTLCQTASVLCPCLYASIHSTHRGRSIPTKRGLENRANIRGEAYLGIHFACTWYVSLFLWLGQISERNHLKGERVILAHRISNRVALLPWEFSKTVWKRRFLISSIQQAERRTRQEPRPANTLQRHFPDDLLPLSRRHLHSPIAFQ